MKNTLSAVLVAIFAAAAPASALEWQDVGPRAVGMGGAGVALSQGPVASYWNPAALGRETENSYGFQMPVGVHAALTGPVIAGANDLKNIQNACSSISASNPSPAGCTQANVNAMIAELNNPSDGLRVNANAGGDFKIGRLAFFAGSFLDAGAVPRMDTKNVILPTQASPNPANSIQNNNSSLILRGANVLQFGIGYGHEVPYVPGLFIGGTVKLMNADVGYARYSVIQNNNGNTSASSTLKSSTTVSSNIGVDAGVLWDVNRSFDAVPFHPKLGLTAHNINNPKFTQSSAATADGVTGKYAVNSQMRMGAAISPFHWWNIAADLDLTRNLTPVDGIASRQFSLGTEINVFNRSWINIPVRVGLSKNLAEPGSSTMLSAGTGLNFLHLIVDVSGTVSPNTIATQTQGQSTKIPQELGAAFQLSLVFGGSDSARRKIQPQSDEEDAAPVHQSQDLAPAKADQVRQNADKAQKELDKAGATPSVK